MSETRPQRTIGAIYEPKNDVDYYTSSKLSKQFDCLIHIDRATSIIPYDVLPSVVHMEGPASVDTPKYAPFEM